MIFGEMMQTNSTLHDGLERVAPIAFVVTCSNIVHFLMAPEQLSLSNLEH